MIPWKLLAHRYEEVTRIDVNPYHAELDAIDRAAVLAKQWKPGHFEDVFTVPVFDGEINEIVELRGVRPPTFAVQTKDAARLAVALRQRDIWLTAAAWVGDPRLKQNSASGGASLPSPDKLLARKSLKPDIATVGDLICVASYPPIPPNRPEQVGPSLYPVVKLLERLYCPPLPEALRKPTQDLRNLVQRIITRERDSQRRWGNRASTKRLDGVVMRLTRLLNDDLELT